MRLYSSPIAPTDGASAAIDLENALLVSQLAGGSRHGVGLKNRDGTYRWTNPAFGTLLGLPGRELVGRDDDALLGPELAAASREREQRVWESGVGETFEQILSDGSIVIGQAVPLTTRDGDGALGVVLSVLPRPRSLERLTGWRERLETRELAGPVGAYEYDLLTGDMTWSGEMAAIYGWAEGTFPTDFSQIMDQQEPDRELVDREMAEYLAQGRPFSFIHRITRLDGAIRTVHSRGFVELNDEGTPVRLAGTEQDLSAHLASQEELADLFAFLQRVLDSVPEAVCVLDGEGHVMFANRVAAAELAEDDDSLVMQPVDAFLDPDAVAEIRGTLRDGRPRTVARTTVRRPGRSPLVMECLCSPLVEGVRLDGAVITLRDISARDRRELQLHSTMRQLGQTNRERELLLAALVDAQEVERRSIAAEVHDDSVQVMSAVGLRLERLQPLLADEADRDSVQLLRDEVRAATGRLRSLLFSLAPPALEHGTADAIAVFARQLGDDVGFSVDVSAGLQCEPPMETRVVLYRIAQEALLNVAKHAHARRVTIRLGRYGGSLVLSIADDGVGFELDDQQARPGHAGLSSMRHRAELVGGRLVLSRGSNGGTIVAAWLPSSRAPEPRADGAPDASDGLS